MHTHGHRQHLMRHPLLCMPCSTTVYFVFCSLVGVDGMPMGIGGGSCIIIPCSACPLPRITHSLLTGNCPEHDSF